MSKTTFVRTLAAAALAAVAGTAAAHTGHGHESLSLMQGLRHALGEPDHLLMLAFGFGICTLAAPRVLGLLRQGARRLRERLPQPHRDTATR